MDPSIYIKPSQQLRTLIESIENPPKNIRATLNEPDSKLTPRDLKWIKENLSQAEKRCLYSALADSALTLPTPIFPERNPDLEKRCQKLRMQQTEREYRHMTRNIRESDTKEKPLSMQFKELNGVIITLIQLLVSVVASFMFGYLAPYYLYGKSETGPRIIFGTLMAFFVGVADLYFVIRENLDLDGIKLPNKTD